MKITALSVGMLMAIWAPASVAFHPAPNVKAHMSKTAIPTTSSDSQTVLNYRDHIEDEGGLLNRLSSPMPRQPQEKLLKTGVQLDIVRSLASSQASALVVISGIAAATLAASGHPVDLNCIHWNGSADSFRPLFAFAQPNGWQYVQGTLAACPMIYLSTQIENSDKRDMNHVNFSTMNMVMTLFGRRDHEHPKSERYIGDHPNLHPETPMMHALLFSTVIAVLTGLSEEIVFRGMLPSAIMYGTHSVAAALVGQAVIFGLGHHSSAATRGENRVICSLQSLSGAWYGMVYLLAGGDILPAIIAHALYDVHVFMETWMQINDQMDYTEQAVLKRMIADDEKEIRALKKEAGSRLSVEMLVFLRRFFYAFDYDHVGSLSKSDVQRAISYAFHQDEEQPTEKRVNDLFDKILAKRDEAMQGDMAHRLKLPEFLRMMLFIRAHRKAQA